MCTFHSSVIIHEFLVFLSLGQKSSLGFAKYSRKELKEQAYSILSLPQLVNMSVNAFLIKVTLTCLHYNLCQISFWVSKLPFLSHHMWLVASIDMHYIHLIHLSGSKTIDIIVCNLTKHRVRRSELCMRAWHLSSSFAGPGSTSRVLPIIFVFFDLYGKLEKSDFLPLMSSDSHFCLTS